MLIFKKVMEIIRDNFFEGERPLFDEIIQRRDSNSCKWDSARDREVLPMWLADMDFRTAPCITQALNKRVQHGIFGYTKVPLAYFDAVYNCFFPLSAMMDVK